jgi:putative tricarboxylic transport membrane protein
MVRDKNNLIAGGCLLAFGIYVITGAARLSYTAEVGPGPGFFPLWIGIGVVIFAAVLMLASYAGAKQPAPSGAPTIRALTGWLAVMIAIFLAGRIGFVVSYILLTAFLIYALDRRPVWLAAAVGVGLSVAFHVLFVRALDVSLPAGPWGF